MRRALIYRERKSHLAEDRRFQKILEYYQRVLVPHEEGTGDFPTPPKTQVEYVGHMLLRPADRAHQRRREGRGLAPRMGR